MTFNVGDKVTWASQAGGHSKTKVGEVIAVVPAGKLDIPLDYFTAGRYRSTYGQGGARDHESYLVLVKSGKGKPTLYWPVASKLRNIEQCVKAETGETPA